jgi:hypothetical protein
MRKRFPSHDFQVCVDQAFSVCTVDGRDHLAPKASSAHCHPSTDRTQLKLAVVVLWEDHNTGSISRRSLSLFWETVVAGAHQAALDMDISFELERLQAHRDDAGDDLYWRIMAKQLKQLCEKDDLDGLIVSIPPKSDDDMMVLDAIRMFGSRVSHNSDASYCITLDKTISRRASTSPERNWRLLPE